jgi:AcrR family transcriptional regulator
MASAHAEPGLQEAKSLRMRERVCRAAAQCLARDGYAETSIGRVATRARVSKGALQHHFPTREDMMAATAEWLLGNATSLHLRNTRGMRAERSTERELLRTWEKGAGTGEFRALMEILVRMRTDRQLRARLGAPLHAWEEQVAGLTREGYEAATGQVDDVEVLMAMHICLVRGLSIQQYTSRDPEFVQRILHRWVEIVSPLLRPRAR